MKHRRRLPMVFGAWWTVGVAALIVVVAAAGFTMTGDWSALLATLILAAFALTIAVLAESLMGLQAVRLRATQALARNHARELGVYAEHFTRVFNELRHHDSAYADRSLAALNTDLLRLHALGVHLHRTEHDA